MHLIIPFLFAVKSDSQRPPDAGIPRDPIPLLHLAWILGREGYELGPPFLNYPEFPYKPQPLTKAEHSDLETPAGPGDMYVIGTRIPASDPYALTRKLVPRGGTTVELAVLAFFAQFFTDCGRDKVGLTADVQRSLLDGCEQYRTMSFELQPGSDIKTVASGDPPEGASMAFYLRTNAMWPGGPGLLAAFSMEVDSSAAWSWHLLQMPELTKRRGFFMFTFEGPEDRKFRGRYDTIASEWKSTLVLEHGFDDESDN